MREKDSGNLADVYQYILVILCMLLSHMQLIIASKIMSNQQPKRFTIARVLGYTKFAQ